jgi:hypothetical protein
MKYAKGHICVLKRHPKLQVPTTLQQNGPLMGLLLDFWKLKCVVQATATKIVSFTSAERILGISSSPAPEQHFRLLPWSADTDAQTDFEEIV